MIWGLKTQYWAQAIRRGKMQTDWRHQCPSAAQGVTGGASCPCHSNTTSAPLPLAQGSLARPNAAICSTELCSCSPAQSEDTSTELSSSRLGFVRVQMGKSWPGTWLFWSQERLLASMSAELHF